MSNELDEVKYEGHFLKFWLARNGLIKDRIRSPGLYYAYTRVHLKLIDTKIQQILFAVSIPNIWGTISKLVA